MLENRQQLTFFLTFNPSNFNYVHLGIPTKKRKIGLKDMKHIYQISKLFI